jgi:hypothetical protein
MKKIFVLLFLVLSAPAFSQDLSRNEEYQPVLYFEQDAFGENFAVMAEADDNYNYFAIDLTKFTTWMERTYFLNLIFSDNTLISIDSDISKEQLWVKAPMDIAETDAICSLEDLRQEAISATGMMSQEEKQAWLDKNKKFQEEK